MKKLSNIIYILSFLVAGTIILFILLASLGLFNNTNSAPLDASSDYQITNYQVEIDVSQDNYLLINEQITAHFSVGTKHGIFRAVPQTSEVLKLDENGKIESRDKMRFNLEVVNSNYPYETSLEGDFNYIRLGNPDVYISQNTSKTYDFSYKLYIDSRYANYNQFYFNVLGNMWDTTIDNFSAKINFEKTVENIDTKVFFGKYGSTEQLNFLWINEGKTLSLEKNDLNVGEGITIFIPFEGQYFKTQFVNWIDFIVLALIALFAVICFILYAKGSNKTLCVPVVQFTLKNKFTPADVGYLVDKKVNNHDIASLIIFWADAGYLKIQEEDDKTYLVRTAKKVGKMKLYEKMLFEEAFKAENEKVEISEIGSRWKDIVSSVRSSIAEENSEAFSKKSVSKRTAIAIIVGIIFAGALALVNYQNCEMIYFYLSFGAGILVATTLILVGKNRDQKFITHGIKKFVNILMLIGVSALLLVFCILSFDSYCDPAFNCFLVFGLYLFALYLIYKFNIRTDEGTKELGDIIGLREFIVVAEKDRLEMMAKEEPRLFFAVMPYAYVLGVYDEWCKKFEKIIIETPEWYVGAVAPDIFDVYMFSMVMSSLNSSLVNSISAADIARIAEQAESMTGGFGGGSGGGGFSGGGFGGGGGGSW